MTMPSTTTDIRVPLLDLQGQYRPIRAAILEAVSGKSYDRCREVLANDRSMSEIGG